MTSRNLIDRGQEVSSVGFREYLSRQVSVLYGHLFWEYVESCSVNSLSASNGSKSSIDTLQNVLSASLLDMYISFDFAGLHL
jgi:hypothetical protein